MVVDEVLVVMRSKQCIIPHHLVANSQTSCDTLPDRVYVPLASLLLHLTPDVTVLAFYLLLARHLHKSKQKASQWPAFRNSPSDVSNFCGQKIRYLYYVMSLNKVFTYPCFNVLSKSLCINYNIKHISSDLVLGMNTSLKKNGLAN